MILNRIFKNRTPTLISTGWTSTVSSTGEIISDEVALGVSGVFASCNIKGNAMGSLPIQVFKKTDKGRIRVTDHPVSYVLGVRPNPYTTPFQFGKRASILQDTQGVSFARIEPDHKGNIKALHFLKHPVSTMQDGEGKLFYIEVVNAEKQNVYSADELLILPYFTLDGINFKSPIQVARESVGTLKAQQGFIATYYKNGTVARGVLKVDQILNKEAKDKVREEWLKANSGMENAHKISVLDGGVSFQNVTIPLEDAKFVTSMNWQIGDIARCFGIPPHKLGILDRATWSNIESENMSFVQDTLLPMVVLWEQEMTYKLFTAKEQKEGYYIKMNLANALRGDSQSRGQFYQLALQNGWMSINEIREREELDSIGTVGDKYRVDLNHVSVDIADEYQLTKANGGGKGGE